MGEILAHTAPLPKNFFRRGSHAGGAGIEPEIFMDAAVQMEKRFYEAPPQRERLQGISSKLSAGPDTGRFKNEGIRFERFRASVSGDLCRCLFPRHRLLR